MNDKSRPVAATTCSTCCYLEMLDAANEIVSDYAELHEQPEGSLGTIAIARRSAERVREHVPCDGPVMSRDGHLTCPLVDLFNAAATMATSRPPTARLAIQLERVVSPAPSKTPGQFL